MGKVLIIKNNNGDGRIHNFAEESHMYSEMRYYYSAFGTPNYFCIEEYKKDFDDKGLVLLITYNTSDVEVIKDIYIGDTVKITDENKIEYIMRVHLTEKENERTIDSIIDKIDLDLSKDFDNECYVMMSNMESLFEELHERIISKNECNTCIVKNEYEEKAYTLNALAQKDSQAVRVYQSSNVGEYRTEFQRDRERVVNCKAFRRLVDKAQIFGAEKGDYFRTRMTHSLEVNQIAKAIAYALGLNLDLTEAIALGHDLGHTPFGHQGERTLDEILKGDIDVGIVIVDRLIIKNKNENNEEIFEEMTTKKLLKENKCFGGFKHNYQSARILTELEEKYKEFPGLNVSVQVVEGVLKHTKLKPNEIDINDFLPAAYLDEINIDNSKNVQVCSSLEGQVVAVADEIAQRGHDVDDALKSGVMTIAELMDRLEINKCHKLRKKIDEEIKLIENNERLFMNKNELKIARIVSIIVNYFIENTINYCIDNMRKYEYVEEICLNNATKVIDFPEDVKKVNDYLEKVVQKKVICNSEVARADYNASVIVKTLFEKYYKNPRLLHAGTVHKIFVETLQHKNIHVSNSAIHLSDGSIELVNYEIADMTVKPLDYEIIKDYLEDKTKHNADINVIMFEKRRILVRAIVDYIAGMTDGYALEEYEKLK